MAASPPRPVSRRAAVPKPAHTLQISPDLEALLQHDELMRCNSGSPTSACNTTSPAFPISLPPPPPRKVQRCRKTSQRGQQEPFLTTRSKEEKRKKGAVAGSDCWPDALPAGATTTTAADSSEGAAGQAAVGTSSRCATPNPYLNPTPVLGAINTPPPRADVVDGPPAPKMAEARPGSSRSAAETRAGSDRPLNKMLWMGRDSLSLFSPNGARSDRWCSGDLDAVQGNPATADGQTRQVSDPSSLRSSSEPSPVRPHSPSHFLPRLSLPSIFMPHNSSPRPQTADNDHLSFIDFFSPPTSDSISCTMPDHSSSSRPQPGSLTISSVPRRDSLTSLVSMRFAEPPSPTVSMTAHPSSPVYPRSDSPITLSSMKFAPPSPCSERIPPTWLQPLSGPPSPYSPLEFAPPPSPLHEVFDKPFLSTAPGLASGRSRKLKPKKRAMSASPRPAHHPQSPLPPTTNQLDSNERADRIRRNRKLARVFGRMPCTEEPLTDVEEPRVSKKLHSPSLAALLTKPKNHRHAVSVSVSVKTPGLKAEPSTPWQTEVPWSPGGRRHSTPLAGSFTLYMDEDGTTAKDFLQSSNRVDSLDAASTRSFIDLSDEEAQEDDVSSVTYLAPHQLIRRRLHHSSSFPSFAESFDSEVQAEDDKRRKREKLAKLHRFLGSRVPPEAVNGCVAGPPLPPLAIPQQVHHTLRGSKSAPPDEFDRGKEELNDREKALNVRRAQKMERVFGTPPPQVLFHTRPIRPGVPVSQPTSPTSLNPYVLTLDLPSTSRNPNQSAYMGKTIHRPGPSDSSRCLLPRKHSTPHSSPSSLSHSFADSYAESMGFQEVLAQSSVYLNYQHSLNSLVDIIDRDDRKSLVELHRFLHGGTDESPSEEEVPANPRRTSNAASFKSERRHSLPSNASMTSLSSEFTSPETSQFQIRRRKAAKLTHFFGVDYRVLIHDILESIEKGVEEECNQGTLQPQEVEVLMHRVRSLRSFSSFDNM